MAIALRITDLVKEFATPSGPLRILDRLSMTLNGGDNLAVVGPSGSGKSTLLHIVGTLDRPTSGTVSVLDHDPFQFGEPELAQFRNRNVGFVFQEHHLLPQLSALENVLIPALAAGSADRASFDRARELLDRVGLEDRINHRPGALSGGERQRVAVARALFNRPKLLLADEPTGSLDWANAELIGQLLLELQRQENVLLICVTHNDQLASLFQHQVRLENGRLAKTESSPKSVELGTQPNS